MNDTYKVRSIGGALLVTIPQQIARLMRLEAGDEMKISVNGVSGGSIVIERAKKPTKGKVK